MNRSKSLLRAERLIAGTMPDMGSPSADMNLTTELDDALTKVAAASAKTRQLHGILGEFCHQIRNLLNCLKLSLYLARRDNDPDQKGFWDDLEAQYQYVERFVDRIQGICRPLTLRPVWLPLALLFEDRYAAWTGVLGARGKELILERPSEAAVGDFDPIRLGEVFDDVVAWRSRAGSAGSDLRVRWSVEGGRFHVVWDEPRRTRISKGAALHRGSEADGSDMLTLPLLTRVVTLHAGTIDVSRSGPWRLDLHWPLEALTHQGESP